MQTVGLLHDVAAHVRASREGRGWSQERLAEAAGLSRDAISRIERGDREPKLATLEAIAAAVGVDVARLMAVGKKPSRIPHRARQQRADVIAQVLSTLEPWLADALTTAVRVIGRAQARARKRK